MNSDREEQLHASARDNIRIVIRYPDSITLEELAPCLHMSAHDLATRLDYTGNSSEPLDDDTIAHLQTTFNVNIIKETQQSR